MENQKSKANNSNMNDKESNTANDNLHANISNYVSGDSTPSSSGHKFTDNRAKKSSNK